VPKRLERCVRKLKNKGINEWAVCKSTIEGSIDHKLRNKLKRMLNDRME